VSAGRGRSGGFVGAARAVSAAPPWGRDDIGVGAMLALLALALAAGGWLWRADRLVYDGAMALWTRPAPADVLIVAIDDASIDAIGRWPWKRSVHATLLERLAAARPRAVLLDLVLSEPDPDPGQDRLLAAALAKAAPVVMPVAWQAAPGEPPRVLEPVPPLRAQVQLGAAESAVDTDGVLRHAFVEAGPPGQLYPHLALALLRAGDQDLRPGMAIERDPALAAGSVATDGVWPRQGRFLVRYSGPPGHVERVSYVDVLRGAVAPERLRGRYLLIGMTAQGLGDTLATPVNASQRAMPGVEVLAHIFDTLRGGDAIHALAPLQVGLISALGVALLVAGFIVGGTRMALALAVLVQPLTLAASVLALRLGLWCSPAPFMLTAVLAYPLWSWRRLERGVGLLDREIQRLAAEPGLLPPTAATVAALDSRDRLVTRLRALHTAADTLRSARRFLADALAGLPAALVVDDGADRVLLANPLAAALFEVESADELQGLDLARLLAEFDCAPPLDWPASLAEVRRTGRGLAVQARLAGQGDYVIHAHAVAMHGGTRLIVAVADVAPIKHAERARDELLAFVSHDLRAPATSISLLADMELAGRGTLAGADLMREVRRLAQRTLALADDFVRVAQATQRPLALETVDVAALLAEVAADFRPQATAAAVELALAVPALAFALDPTLVQRAVGNLLSNAIRHSPAGAAVTVSAERLDDGALCLRVRDQGPGLTAESLIQVQQLREGLVSRAPGGAGFGLLFVQRVAERHGGLLRAHAAEPRGTVFELRLRQSPMADRSRA
jgi:CHASE2 domain-containing sensor protein/signal transduction histidine kinase